ncbi:MAG: DUF4097 domain-containing protein [bacterium]|nr:DUF4097 domain-containing protein [bacterium]
MRRCMVCLSVLLVLTLGAVAQQEVDESRPASADGVVTVRNPAGSVKIIGWAKDEVHVAGTLGRNVKRLEFDTGRKSSSIRVIVPRFKKRRIEATLTLCVPAGSVVKVQTVSAGVEVTDVIGPVAVDTVSGKATVLGKPAAVSVETVSGDVAVGAITSKARIESTSGDVAIEGAIPEVDVETVSGDIQFQGKCARFETESVSGDVKAEGIGPRVDAETMSGDIRLGCTGIVEGKVSSMSGAQFVTALLSEKGTLALESHSGRIELTLAGDAPGEIHVKTFSGNLKTSLPMTLTEFDESHSGRDLTLLGATSDATGTVDLRTFSGDIRLSQAD